ncbi:hypothetical protein KIPE111705_29610 [Kibdelosporangium persicum]|uniref:PPE family protein n=1 Tax=Kibdelosporangium persicum TaxID=2698649 RepID=A0ABX2EZX3_9PSEU|nr:hypothetical protein [Kibdelosporangium persicum]NRN64439.1 hypothetical protein [Kibdelosporangium persicum]
MFLTGEQIYDNFTRAAGPGDLIAAAEEVRHIANECEALGIELLRLTEKMEQAWQGDSADAARHGARPLADAHAEASPLIYQAQDLSVRQAASFHDARNAVKPVPPMPERPDPWALIFSWDAGNTYAARIAEYRAAVQHNVDVMTGYSNASAFNTAGQPTSFGSIRFIDADVAVASPQGRPVPGPGPRRLPGGVVQGPERPVLPSGGPEDALTVPPDPAQQQRSQHDVVKTAATNLPTPAANPVVGPQAHAPSGTDLPSAQGAQADAVQAASRSSTSASNASRGSRVLPRLDGRGDSAASGDSVGSGGTAARPGGGRPLGGALRGGAGSLPDTAGAPRGGPHFPFLSPGKPRSAEDEEHRRPEYLRERDPESTFGTDEPTTPPVIG